MAISIILTDCKAIHVLTAEQARLSRPVVLAAISPEDEANLDNKQPITVNFTNKEVLVEPTDIICYGEIHFDDEDELDDLDSFNIINNDPMRGVPIYSTLHFRDATIDNKQYYHTWSTVDVVKQAYCQIGKPERVALFYSYSKKKKR